MTKMLTSTNEDPGDDSVVLRGYLKWVGSAKEALTAESGPALGHLMRNDGGVWELCFSIQRGPNRRQRHFIVVNLDEVARPDRWPLVKLGPGVFDVPVSIHIHGQIHGFVTLFDVPEPPPWE